MNKREILLGLSALLAFTVGSAFAEEPHERKKEKEIVELQKCEIKKADGKTVWIEVPTGKCEEIKAKISNGDLSDLSKEAQEKLEGKH